MMTMLRLKTIFLHSVGVLLAAGILAAAGPAWSQEEGFSAGAVPQAEGFAAPMPAEQGYVAAADAEMPVPAAEHETATAHEENIGFPQLDARTYSSQVFWLLVFFAVLYGLMSKIALPRIAEVIDMRETQKNGNLSRAEQLQEEASKVEAAYESSLAKAQELAQGAIADAEETVTEKLGAENARFSEQARKRIATAEQNIAKAKADALASIADISAEIAADIVHKIADVQVTRPDAKKAVLAEMQKG